MNIADVYFAYSKSSSIALFFKKLLTFHPFQETLPEKKSKETNQFYKLSTSFLKMSLLYP